MLFLPVSRPWAAVRVVKAFNESDIPRKVMLLLDAPDCEEWVELFTDCEWDVYVAASANPDPPTDRLARRMRHIQMRRASQYLIEQFCDPHERVLFSEDDTLVPTDVWSRLNTLMDDGAAAATGWQYDRNGSGLAGLWRYNADVDVFDPVSFPDESYPLRVDACGHYCLLTTAQSYSNAIIPLTDDVPVDRSHTYQLKPLVADLNCYCGHLLEDGTVL